MLIFGSSLKLCGHHAPTSSTSERQTTSTDAAIRTSACRSTETAVGPSCMIAITRSFP